MLHSEDMGFHSRVIERYSKPISASEMHWVRMEMYVLSLVMFIDSEVKQCSRFVIPRAKPRPPLPAAGSTVRNNLRSTNSHIYAPLSLFTTIIKQGVSELRVIPIIESGPSSIHRNLRFCFQMISSENSTSRRIYKINILQSNPFFKLPMGTEINFPFILHSY